MEISFFDIIGNGLSNNEIVKVIIKKLEEKYNQEFMVKKIGDRYGIGKTNEVTTFCFPLKDEKMIFKVVFDMMEEKIIYDDFYIRSTCYELEKSILQEFQSKNIESVNKIEIIGKNKLDRVYSVQDFSDTFNKCNFLATIVIKNPVLEIDLLEIINNIKNKYKNIYLKNLIYNINNDFCEFKKNAETLSELSEAYIEKYSIKKMYIMKIYNNEVIKIK